MEYIYLLQMTPTYDKYNETFIKIKSIKNIPTCVLFKQKIPILVCYKRDVMTNNHNFTLISLPTYFNNNIFYCIYKVLLKIEDCGRKKGEAFAQP